MLSGRTVLQEIIDEASTPLPMSGYLAAKNRPEKNSIIVKSG